MNNILELPEDCLHLILSLTSPLDVVRLSTVSKQFLAVSNSDTVWEKFLPSWHDSIVYWASSLLPRLRIGNKKDLFMYLCDFPVIFDNSSKSFALDKRSGKTCYMHGSRALSITWGSSPEYWRWESVTGSRFPECAVLRNVCWLEILGKIQTRLLSPRTAYGVYFVFKFKADSYGFERSPVKVTVTERREDGLPILDGHQVNEVKRYLLIDPTYKGKRLPGTRPVVRGDGWMEVEMGTYQVGVNGEKMVLEMSLKEIEIGNWKARLVVDGIEIRPLP